MLKVTGGLNRTFFINPTKIISVSPSYKDGTRDKPWDVRAPGCQITLLERYQDEEGGGTVMLGVMDEPEVVLEAIRQGRLRDRATQLIAGHLGAQKDSIFPTGERQRELVGRAMQLAALIEEA